MSMAETQAVQEKMPLATYNITMNTVEILVVEDKLLRLALPLF